MKTEINRRSLLRIAGMSLGIGVLYEFAPFLSHRAGADAISDFFKKPMAKLRKVLLSLSSAIRTSASRARPTLWAPGPLKMQWR